MERQALSAISAQFCHILLSRSGERAIPGEWNASQITEARIKLRGSSNVSQSGQEPFCPITGGALMQPSEKITASASARRYRSDRPMREVNREHSRRAYSAVSLSVHPAVPYFKGWRLIGMAEDQAVARGHLGEPLPENVNRAFGEHRGQRCTQRCASRSAIRDAAEYKRVAIPIFPRGSNRTRRAYRSVIGTIILRDERCDQTLPAILCPTIIGATRAIWELFPILRWSCT